MTKIKIGTKVRTVTTWFRPQYHDTLCTVGALPDNTTPLYRLDSPAFLSGHVYRTREEFTVIGKD